MKLIMGFLLCLSFSAFSYGNEPTQVVCGWGGDPSITGGYEKELVISFANDVSVDYREFNRVSWSWESKMAASDTSTSYNETRSEYIVEGDLGRSGFFYIKGELNGRNNYFSKASLQGNLMMAFSGHQEVVCKLVY